VTVTPGTAVPTLSVVVPARNSSQWIAELVESIVAQELPGLEIVLVDNGSDDATADIAEAAAGSRTAIRVVRSTASSAAGARNEGVAVATGEYLVFADADDLVPDGAYRAMLSSLEASGSDMVIGDHLKFAAGSTWSPTQRWWPFDRPVVGVRPVDVPQLLSGRACWNRMFRRSFWDDAGLRFPDLPSLEDVLPMTTAFVEARAIDIVTECVYLYRDRADDSSLSRRADLGTTLRYFEQERRCAALTAEVDVLRRQHAAIVLDADGWAHLERFLRAGPSSDDVAAVSAAARELLDALTVEQLDDVPAVRRALWLLVLHGPTDTAVQFARMTAGAAGSGRIAAWVQAVVGIDAVDREAARSLATEGVVPALVNGADALDEGAVADQLDALGSIEPTPGGTDLGNAMVRAMASRDPVLVRRVAALRRVVPLVVSNVSAEEARLTLSGAVSVDDVDASLALGFDGPGRAAAPLQEDPASGGWSAEVPAALLPDAGRYDVRLVVGGVEGSFPVVTARMPLPPLGSGHKLQPLADRQDGWRFLVDRRADRRALPRLAARLRSRLRRDG
jgi:hypothetical protein